MPVPSFPKRLYRLPEITRDVRELVRDLKAARRARRVGVVDHAFQERIMLAVTQVNGCIYCTALHRRVAGMAGVAVHEISSLLGGRWTDAPEEQRAALDFADHWARTQGRPDVSRVEALARTYGEDGATAVIMAIRSIMFGNLYGNSFEAWKNRFTGGPRSGRGFWAEVVTLASPAWVAPWTLVKMASEWVTRRRAPRPSPLDAARGRSFQ